MKYIIALSAFIFTLLCAHEEANACQSAPTPRLQSMAKFYDKERFGYLGIAANDQYAYILDEYKCYDLSFIRNKILSFYFNSASKDSTAEPTYIGALIARSFTSGTSVDGPYSSYFYRNTAHITDGDVKWAHGDAVEGVTLPRSTFKVLNDKHDPETPLRATDFKSLSKALRLQPPGTSDAVRQWHALLIKATGDNYYVYRDTASSDTSWTPDQRLEDTSASYVIFRSYLVKYQVSTNPTSDVFFQSGAASADCVYIKLIAPGDGLSNLAISGAGGEFISLKMRATARCKDPAVPKAG